MPFFCLYSKRKYSYANSAFTLLEVLMSVFVIILGIIGVFSLMSQTLSLPLFSSSRLIAAYLGQEGIEIVRNIRDSNRLAQRNWDSGLSPGDWEADYNDSGLMVFANRPLLLGGGFYNYGSGIRTRFRRKITISSLGVDILRISVQVQWQDKGRTNQIIVQGDLYNWK